MVTNFRPAAADHWAGGTKLLLISSAQSQTGPWVQLARAMAHGAGQHLFLVSLFFSSLPAADLVCVHEKSQPVSVADGLIFSC
jgi:hypothetical protein